MRKHKHGKDMQIVYLRMMLLSIDKGGYIYYQGVYDSLEEELAEEFDEPVEIIQETLEYLKQNNMVSVDENSDCFVPESLRLTGSECSSAERVRKYRDNKKALQSNTDVTDSNADVTSSNSNVTSCNVEKEIELKKEKEKRKNTMCKADALALFERLWKLYPVKKGKGQVSLTAKQRLLKVGYEEMARAISRYKADLEKDRGWRKPQNGSTFFNSGYIDYLDKNYGDAADAEPVLEEDVKHSSSGKQISKSKEEVEAEIYKIVHNRISQEALERYHDKIHELIRMCCPLESFTQEQIDYMWREWGMEPAPKVDTLIPPDESNFSFWDHRLYSK